jgi:hypothetical protein
MGNRYTLNEGCAEFESTGCMNDQACFKLFPYICEKSIWYKIYFYTLINFNSAYNKIQDLNNTLTTVTKTTLTTSTTPTTTTITTTTLSTTSISTSISLSLSTTSSNSALLTSSAFETTAVLNLIANSTNSFINLISKLFLIFYIK